jgi:molybdate transport system substrate-binding protein
LFAGLIPVRDSTS